MDGVLAFIQSAVGNPVVGLILVGVIIGFILSRR